MLEIKSLSVSYGKILALKNVSLSVSPGEVVALIGPNGAGKSTLIRTVSGVIKPQTGEISYQSKDTIKMRPIHRARIMAVVPQAQQMGGAFSVEHAVLMGRTAYMNWLGQPTKTDHEIVQAALEKTHTVNLAKRRIAQLSGGEQQRVLLARALAQETPLLLLDEPTNHLDLQHQSAILSLVRKQATENGLAVLMALHDLNLVSMYADRVVLLVGGKRAAIGKPEEVLTVEQISKAYNTEIQVLSHPESSIPIILPSHKGQQKDSE